MAENLTSLGVAYTEPPRVRAMLGALGTHLGKSGAALKRLRASLNPFSKFDFGALAGLPHAFSWQAKERQHRVKANGSRNISMSSENRSAFVAVREALTDHGSTTHAPADQLLWNSILPAQMS